MDPIKAIEDALAAGPTPGPWYANDARGSRYIETQSDDVIAQVFRDGRRCFAADAAYIAACHPEAIRALLDRLREAEAKSAAWESLYRRAVNQANGLTNYVEDRPELRHAERRLTEIEAEARAMKETP